MMKRLTSILLALLMLVGMALTFPPAPCQQAFCWRC